MCKFSLRFLQTRAGALDEVRRKVNELILAEARGPGDVDNAMRRLEARFALPYALLWAWRYRPPKKIDVAEFLQVRCAHDAVFSRPPHPSPLPVLRGGEAAGTEANDDFAPLMLAAE